MSFNYHDLWAMTTLRINALVGTDAAALETTYTTRPLTDINFDSTIFPPSAIRDALLNTEGTLADAIASTGDHPFRAYLISTTGPLANMASLPMDDTNGLDIIGIYGSVYDASDGIVC